MALSASAGPSHPPGAVELLRCLGGAAPLWNELVAHVTATFPPLEEVWTFAGAKLGWSLCLKREDRVLHYLTPGEGCIHAGLVPGQKSVAAAAWKGLPPAVLGLLAAAPRYAEGRGLRLRIATGDDLEPLRRLVALKADVPPKARRRALAAVQPPT